jgi:hypothetical protein
MCEESLVSVTETTVGAASLHLRSQRNNTGPNVRFQSILVATLTDCFRANWAATVTVASWPI